jgi:TPR repeat protein
MKTLIYITLITLICLTTGYSATIQVEIVRKDNPVVVGNPVVAGNRLNRVGTFISGPGKPFQSSQEQWDEAKSKIPNVWLMPNTPVDDKKLLEWQYKQATNGMPSSQYDIGIRYLKGIGVTNNITNAVYWFKKSAEQNNIQAKLMLDTLSKTNRTN